MGNDSRQAPRAQGWLVRLLAAGAMAAPASAQWAQDLGARPLQQLELQRQQQGYELELRMRQAQEALRQAPADAKQRQALEHAQAVQRARQHELHSRQGMQPAAAHPDDEGTRRAKAELERLKADRESRQDLQQPAGPAPSN